MTDRTLDLMLVMYMHVDHEKLFVIVTPTYLIDETSWIDTYVVNGTFINNWIVFVSNSHEYVFFRIKKKTYQI